MDSAAAAVANPLMAKKRPSLSSPAAAAASSSKRNVLDEGLHASNHGDASSKNNNNKRFSFELEPEISLSDHEDDDDGCDEVTDAAGTSAADSFCDASIGSEADVEYLQRGMSFTMGADGQLVDLIEFYREEIEGKYSDDDDDETEPVSMPDRIANRAIQLAQENGDFDELCEDALEAEIRKQMEKEDRMRKMQADLKRAKADQKAAAVSAPAADSVAEQTTEAV
jgi:hypothetical protein